MVHSATSLPKKQVPCQYLSDCQPSGSNPNPWVLTVDFRSGSNIQIRILRLGVSHFTAICDIVLEMGWFKVFYPVLRIWILTILSDFQTIRNCSQPSFILKIWKFSLLLFYASIQIRSFNLTCIINLLNWNSTLNTNLQRKGNNKLYGWKLPQSVILRQTLRSTELITVKERRIIFKNII